MSTIRPVGRWYWERFTDGDGGWTTRSGPPPGEQLAALRRGAGRVPGTVPEMWQYHAAPVPEERLLAYSDMWDPPIEYAAEHHTLVLFGHHQQSKREPMHRRVNGSGFGAAVRSLHTSDRYSREAVDRRFYAAVTTDRVEELAVHLRGLVNQLRTLPAPRPLDYTRLVHDIRDWHFPVSRDRVRRRWGLQYHTFEEVDTTRGTTGS